MRSPFCALVSYSTHPTTGMAGFQLARIQDSIFVIRPALRLLAFNSTCTMATHDLSCVVLLGSWRTTNYLC